MAPETLALLVGVLVFAGFVKGATGFGLPLIAVPVLANIIGPKTAVVVMSIPVLLVGAYMAVRTSAWRVTGEMGPLRWLLVAIFVGTIAGANILANIDTALIGLIVGVTAVAFTLLSLRTKPPDITGQASFLAPAVGLAAGLLSGTTSTPGPLLAMYLRSIRLEKTTFVAAINLLFTLTGAIQIASFLQVGLYTQESLLYGFAATIPITIATMIGMRAHFLMGQRLFDQLVLAVIFVSGLRLILSTIWR